MNEWKEAFKKVIKETNWKQELGNWVSTYIMAAVAFSSYQGLVHLGVLEEITNWWLLFAVGVVTFYLAGYAVAKHDAHLFRRRIMKAAREVARFEGIDPKTLNYKDIKMTVDKEGYVDIEIEIKRNPDDQER